MALDPLPFPQEYPDVPYATGVPPVMRDQSNNAESPSNDPIVLSSTDGAAVEANQPPTRWGIYTSGGFPVIVGDGCVAFEYDKDYRVSDYPQENGSFRSYNKVETPFQVRVTIQKGGSSADRQDFLNTVEAVLYDASTLFEVVTADQTYTSVTVNHADYRRTVTNGATLLTVELRCEQIRLTAVQTFSSTAQPGGAEKVSGGPVQPHKPTPAQVAAAPKVN